MSSLDCPVPRAEIARVRILVYHHLNTSKPIAMRQSSQTIILPNPHNAARVSCSKIKQCSLCKQCKYVNTLNRLNSVNMYYCQKMQQSDYPIFRAEIDRARKRFQEPLLTSKPATLTQSAQVTISLNSHKTMELSHSKIR